ncbi:TonB-dependent receptor [uncultured Bacteroides sp.]|uniref:TonB-dependent receptor n=1 Tax=uncultured Bacteroides sp. TaxID=162156 RepID=UPI0025D4E0B3|nr:TonB-dependent receptor [uncultured Bacteroides sp.]
MFCKVLYFILFLFISHLTVSAQRGYTLTGTIQDAQTKEPLSFATIQLQTADKTWYGALSDTNGRYTFTNLTAGTYTASVSFLGYDKSVKTFSLSRNTTLSFSLTSSVTALNEVVITASESKGLTSASKIDRKAMEHLQPTSFTDLLELLPGGKSVDPNMDNVNLIRIREAGSTNEAIASLGVGFVVDGMAINTDANLQYLQGTSQADKESVSKGVDMRTLSTDNIESVEIIRGIPSVEYGNLTGGLVNIKRKSSASPLTARFKADQVSKLFSAGKGYAIGGTRVLNLDLSYLDSKVDPRDSRENYKRITASARLNTNYKARIGHIDWRINADYTGSFDNVKQDKDVTAKEDSYKSSYDKMTLGSEWILKRPEHSFLRQLRANTSVSQEFSRIEERKSVSLDRPTGIPNSLIQGEADGLYLPYNYVADMLIDGKPFYASAKVTGDFAFGWLGSSHTLKAGAEWNLSKNFGKGQVYDLSRPIQTASTTRPRRYSKIPARQDVSIYAEEQMKLPLGKHEIHLSAGVRANTLAGLSGKFAMQSKFYFDPRINLKWTLPALGREEEWLVDISGGIGWLSRMPTTAQLYPDALYVDVIQLNYYHNNPDFRRINMMTYKWDNTNYNLKPARNRKWEARLNIARGGYGFSVTYFQERMDNAFRDVSYYRTLAYKKYDTSTINSSELAGPPALEGLPYAEDSLINAYRTAGNGTRVRKEGVEFTFHTPRIKRLQTRFTVTGAWLKSTYSNGVLLCRESSVMLNGEQLKYVGLYDWDSTSRTQEAFNTNVTADTYLQKIGMSFSLTAQCMWYTSSQPLWNSGMPVSYVDKAGNVHPFTAADASDAQLQHLVTRYGDRYFDRVTVPAEMNVNLKATKRIGKYMELSLYVNRILAVSPDYHRGNQLIRRVTNPYFGMEANLRF